MHPVIAPSIEPDDSPIAERLHGLPVDAPIATQRLPDRMTDAHPSDSIVTPNPLQITDPPTYPVAHRPTHNEIPHDTDGAF
jgi:hypothetical protein